MAELHNLLSLTLLSHCGTFPFLKLPRNKVEGPGGLLTEPLVWL